MSRHIAREQKEYITFLLACVTRYTASFELHDKDDWSVIRLWFFQAVAFPPFPERCVVIVVRQPQEKTEMMLG